MVIEFIKKWIAELTLCVLIIACIILASIFPAFGDKFLQALISSFSAYVAYNAFKITQKNASLTEKNQLESRSPHFRIIDTTFDRAYQNITIKLLNAGGTMLVDWDWNKTQNENESYGLRRCQQSYAEMFPSQGFQLGYETMGGNPVYLKPNEIVNIKFSATTEPLGTGTQINVRLRFWDIKDGLYRVQTIAGNIMIARIDTGPAIAEI